jgi:serine/threonine protein kinase
MNLQEFFRTKNACSLETLYAGMFGLADALVYIHNFTFKEGDVTFSRIGYHHDLKPKNIPMKGETFLLAGFGLSKLKAEDVSSKTRLKGGDDDYLAPEYFNYECLNNQVGRALDMWSFGCILAEFATYMKFGKGSIDMFREFRKITHQIGAIAMTHYAFHLNGSLRPEVTNWLYTLTHDPEDVHICRLVDLYPLISGSG